MDSLKQQKSLLNQYTVPTIISTISFFDYHHKYRTKTIEDHSMINQFLVRTPLRHNSPMFQTYHETAKYFADEYNSTSTRGRLMILKSLAFSGYPNKPFFDTFIYRVMNSALKKEKSADVLAELIYCHALLRRVSSMTDYMVEKMMDQDIVYQNPRVQIWISYICSLGNLY